MTEMSGAECIVEALKREGVKTIFGVIGGATMTIYDVLMDSDIKHILTRHEQGAAHMADGFARASGKVGVCMATSGPGATNLVTGISTAYIDSSPIVAFTGQVNTPSTDSNSSYMIGRDAFQEADIIGITAPITKYNMQIMKTEEIPEIVKKAFYIASTHRPGPVLVDIPKNTQTNTAEVNFPEKVVIRGYNTHYKADPIQLKRAVDLFVEAERPMVLAGGGIIISNASQELTKLAELLMMPVATSLMGKGSIPENHPLSIGMLGMHGQEANKLILEADVLLAIGIRFSDRTTGNLDEFCPDARIIHVDIDPAEINKNINVDVPIVADAKECLQTIYSELTSRLVKREKSVWSKRIKEARELLLSYSPPDERSVNPKRIISELRRMVPNNTIVTTGVGQQQMWAAQYFKTYLPRTFMSSGGLGTMGYGLPAAIGAKVAKPDVTVIDIDGDGSFRMTEQELACSVMEEIPVIAVILNNRTLGMVAQWQRLFFNRRLTEVDLGYIPNFTKLAEAYGAKGVQVESMKGFSDAVKRAMKSDVTTVIDVAISPEENVFPMIPAGKGLKDTLWGL
jgi:acetolactate synthase-1/2/3 large subunit